MDSLRAAVENLIAERTGCPARIADERAMGGGCIHQARAITLDDGRSFFVKSNPAPLPRMFECEAEGLNALGETRCIRVPQSLGTGGVAGGAAFIVMERLQPGRPGTDFWETFGRQLAQLHRQTASARFGFDADNYLGGSLQHNSWHGDWTEFWREHRLGAQLRLARRNGFDHGEFQRRGERLLERLGEWIAEPAEPACLLHGDLWSGNFLCDARGEPALIDPAVYFGRREAELAMTRLFGGFDPRFYRAYEECWPLAAGSSERLEIYQLYHLLNHLNLFGAGYLGACLAILRRFG